MAARTFLLGVGCQKGGTTWLDAYLRAAPDVAPGFLKEYHLWDVLDDLPAAGRLRERFEAAAAEGDPAARRRVAFWSDPTSSFDYFAGLLEAPGIRLTADITPAYAGLGVDRLRWVRDGFERRGIEVRAVFLMRDPVERIWSAVRMHVKRHGGDTAEQRVLATYAGGFHEPRTRYDRTMANLDGAFDPEAVHYAFYEELFSPASVRALCDFLDIGYREPDLGRRLNASPKAAELSEETVRRVARHYRPVYDAVAARFGAGRIDRLWPNRAHAG